jgi:hypothetical protein
MVLEIMSQFGFDSDALFDIAARIGQRHGTSLRGVAENGRKWQ